MITQKQLKEKVSSALTERISVIDEARGNIKIESSEILMCQVQRVNRQKWTIPKELGRGIRTGTTVLALPCTDEQLHFSFPSHFNSERRIRLVHLFYHSSIVLKTCVPKLQNILFCLLNMFFRWMLGIQATEGMLQRNCRYFQPIFAVQNIILA